MLSSLSRHPLARDIIAVLTIKIILITLAAVFLFPGNRRPVVNSEVVAQKLFGMNDVVVKK